MCSSCVFIFLCLVISVHAWEITINRNPGCDAKCLDFYPNLAHIRAQNRIFSIHFFTAASKALGPPSIFIVHSSKPDAMVKYNWTRLLDNVTYDGITVENATEIYGISYLSIADFRDGNGYGDLWTASQSNKTFTEYYLSRFEYTLVKVDLVPDDGNGLIEIVYKTDSFRRHNLVSNGGYVEIKFAIPVKDGILDGLRAGLSFKSEISFHDLNILHPDSQLGVAIVIFSNHSLSSSEDFREVVYTSQNSLAKGVAYVHLEEESVKSIIDGRQVVPSTRITRRTPVLFHPHPEGLTLEGSTKKPFMVFAGPRQPLKRASQRRRLRPNLAKALYGRRLDQSFQKVRGGGLKFFPVGMRMQQFSFMAPGQETAKSASWSTTLTVDMKGGQHNLLAPRSSRSQKGLNYWAIFALNWVSSFYGH